MNAQLSHAEAQARSSSRRQPIPPVGGPSKRRILIVLAVCMALQMTSFVIILPLFARRFSEFGAGVESLGLSAMAYALTSTLAAPFMGALADRSGRRRLVLASLAAYILAFTGYLLASSASAFILIRALAGAFTAGLIPAATGIVADLAPIERRAQWIGILNGGASVGWIAGPVLGGMLYDHWGYNLALFVSIIMATVAFTTALLMIPETHKNLARTTGATRRAQTFRLSDLKSSVHTFRNTLPHSLSTFVVLLTISLAVMFAWAFIEPRFMFYAYDDLGWSSSMLGLVMSTYGIAMTLGEFFLSHLSDRLGRKPVIVCGLMLFAAQFIGLAFFRDYILIAGTFVVAGLGNALFDPALSASILDIAPAEHQSHILGIKSTAGSLGNILGPALVVLFTPFLEARGIFLAATGIVCMSVLFFLSAQIKPRSSWNDRMHAEIDGDLNPDRPQGNQP
jgi:MFS family permease